MDLLDGLFHPHNLTYVRCCQASSFSPSHLTLLKIIKIWQAALCSAIIREDLSEALQWGEALMDAARMVKGSKAHLELASRSITVFGMLITIISIVSFIVMRQVGKSEGRDG